MLRFVRATAYDVLAIKVQPAQRNALLAFGEPGADAVMRESIAHAAYLGNECIAAAGITPKWPGSATAWAVLSVEAGPHLPAITIRCAAMLSAAPFKRIEATAACDFPAAARWLKLLGFELETVRARSYTPDGQDVSIFARVKLWTP